MPIVTGYTAIATGGTTTFFQNADNSIDEIHTFSSSGNYSLIFNKYPLGKKVNALIIGGGSSAATFLPGVRGAVGGGAGRCRQINNIDLNNKTNSVVVGAGGTVNGSTGSSGGQSSFIDNIATGGIMPNGNFGGRNEDYGASGYGGAGSGGAGSGYNGGGGSYITLTGTPTYFAAGGRSIYGGNTGTDGYQWGTAGSGGRVNGDYAVTAGYTGLVVIRFPLATHTENTGNFFAFM